MIPLPAQRRNGSPALRTPPLTAVGGVALGSDTDSKHRFTRASRVETPLSPHFSRNRPETVHEDGFRGAFGSGAEVGPRRFLALQTTRCRRNNAEGTREPTRPIAGTMSSLFLEMRRAVRRCHPMIGRVLQRLPLFRKQYGLSSHLQGGGR